MAIPPPPPPGPPPPPVPKLNTGSGLGSLGGGSGGGDTRNALLLSIQKGAKLKKAVTNDKSGPAIAGRVAGGAGGANNGGSSTSSSGERRAGVPGGGGGGVGGGGGPMSNGGGPKLAGIFGGMSEMPKLKPVNRSGANSSSSTLNRSPPRSNNSSSVDQQNTSIASSISSSSSSSSNNNNNSISNNSNGSSGGALDFNTELTMHLTLKKKKLHQSPSPTPSGVVAGPGNVTEANLRNRGPPPQPPPPPKNPPAPPPINGIAANSSSLFGGNSNGPAKSQPSVPRQTQVVVKFITVEPTLESCDHVHEPHYTSASSAVSVNNTFVVTKSRPLIVAPKPQMIPANKSSLFNTNTSQVANESSLGSTQPPEEAQIVSGSVSEMKRLLSQSGVLGGGGVASKPVPNFGKPNLAPKPPGNQLTAPGSANVSTPTSPVLSPGLHGAVKATVSRHHSMKTPRSPPVAPPTPGAPVYPSPNHFGTMRAPPSSQYQSQEAISSNATPPVNGRPIGRPTVAPPPRPPPNKPPPPPLRSVSNQNLPQMPLSTPTTNTLNSAASANNVSVLKEQLKHHIGNGSAMGGSGGGSAPNVERVTTNGNGVAPPLPPHRTCPAPPPPNASRQQSNNSAVSSSAGPPVPPQRHSSIRSVSVTDSAPLVVKPINTMNNGGDMSGGGAAARLSSINRIIIDLESKFADRFHNPTEFPKPAPFFKTEKHYPSLSRAKNAAAAESRKQRAPRPPARQPAPLPPDCDTLGDGNDQENTDPAKTTTMGREQSFVQLADNKLLENEMSHC